MKVLHLLQSNRFSGAENVVCQIINMFGNDAGFEMVYCSSDGQIREALDERGVRFVPLQSFSVGEIKKVFNKEEPDIIHAHDARASVMAALCCGKTPLIVHMHGNSKRAQGLTLKSVSMCVAAQKAKHIFWVSNAAFEKYCFAKLFSHKGSVLRNVIDIDAVRKKADEAERQTAYDAVYVGRLEYPKDPERVAKLLCDIVQANDSFSAAVVGSGSYGEKIKKYIIGRGLENRVVLLGHLKNPLGIVKNAKVMLMASRWEGMPISAVEAMCLGVPLVCAPKDGLCELIVDGETGYLSENDETIVDKSLEIIRDRGLRSKMSEAAEIRAEKLMDTNNYFCEVRSAYMQCLRTKADSREER